MSELICVCEMSTRNLDLACVCLWLFATVVALQCNLCVFFWHYTKYDTNVCIMASVLITEDRRAGNGREGNIEVAF